MKKIFVNYFFTALVIAVTVWILISSSKFSIIPHLIAITDGGLLFLAFVCMVLFWFFDALIIKVIVEISDQGIRFWQYMKIALIGQYYSSITPFSGGGQPVAQVYTMKNDYKIPLGLATSVTINKFTIYHIIVTAFALVMAIFKYDFIFEQGAVSKTFIAIGFMINIISTLALLLLCYNSSIVKKVCLLILRLLHKIKLAKNMNDQIFSRHIEEYRSSLRLFLRDRKALLLTCLYTLIQVIVYFCVTYFVYLSFGLRDASLFDILAVQSLHYMAINYIPTPGNAGASEGGFYLIFGLVFPSGVMIYAIMLWRLIVYYLNLFVGGIVVLIDYLYKQSLKKS